MKLHKFIPKDLRHVCSTDQLSQLFGKQKKYVNILFLCHGVVILGFKGLFTWSGGPWSSGVGFFCFHALEATKQKKPTPLDQGPPLHVKRV